jgi:hypothetical protein
VSVEKVTTSRPKSRRGEGSSAQAPECKLAPDQGHQARLADRGGCSCTVATSSLYFDLTRAHHHQRGVWEAQVGP